MTSGTFLTGALVINVWLPKYHEAVPILSVMIFSMYFMPQTSLIRNFWMVDRRLPALASASMFTLSVMTIGLVMSAWWFDTLQGVAVAVLIAWAAHYSYLLATVGRTLWGTRGTLWIAGNAAASLAYTGSVVFVIRYALDGAPAGTPAFIGVFSAFLLITPILFLGLWSHRSMIMRTDAT
jgi:hypothetical protein